MPVFLGNNRISPTGGGGGGGSAVNTYSAFHVFPTAAAFTATLDVVSATELRVTVPDGPTSHATGQIWTLIESDGTIAGAVTITASGGQTFRVLTRNAAQNAVITRFFTLFGVSTDNEISAASGNQTDTDRTTRNWNFGTGLYEPEAGGVFLATGRTIRDITNRYPNATPNTASHSEQVVEAGDNFFIQRGAVHSFYHPTLRTFFTTGSGGTANGPEANISMGGFQHETGDTSDWRDITDDYSMSPPPQLGRNTPYQLSGAGSLDRVFLYAYDPFFNSGAGRLLALQIRNNNTAGGTGGFLLQNTTAVDISTQLAFNTSFGAFTNWEALAVQNEFSTLTNNPVEVTNNGSTFKLEVDPNSGEIYIHYVAMGGVSIVRSFNNDGSDATTSFTPVAGSPAEAFTTEARVVAVNNNGTTEWWWQNAGDWFMSTGFNVAGSRQFSGGVVSGTVVNPQTIEAISATEFIGYQGSLMFRTTPTLVRTVGDGTTRAVTTSGLDGTLDLTVFYQIA